MFRYLFIMFTTLYLSVSAYSFAAETDKAVIDREQFPTRQESSNQMMTATGKQRLSTKGQDDNRVNDCRVAEKFRLDKTREAQCKHEHVTQHLKQ